MNRSVSSFSETTRTVLPHAQQYSSADRKYATSELSPIPYLTEPSGRQPPAPRPPHHGVVVVAVRPPGSPPGTRSPCHVTAAGPGARGPAGAGGGPGAGGGTHSGTIWRSGTSAIPAPSPPPPRRAGGREGEVLRPDSPENLLVTSSDRP